MDLRPRHFLTAPAAPLVVIILAVTALTPSPADAATATCEGQTATLVGSGPGTTITGTQGPDVIVSNGADVDALGGDDLICVTTPATGAEGRPTVYAGTGDDTVDTVDVARSTYSTVFLGSGSDTFVGGAEDDVVHAAGYEDSSRTSDAPDTETDTIDTGTSTGDDSVFSGAAGLANADVVHLGGFGYVTFDGLPGAGRLTSAQSGSQLSLDSDETEPAARWTIDDRHHRISAGDAAEPMTGFTFFVPAATTSVSMIGGPLDEVLDAQAPTVDASMGAGDDLILSRSTVHGTLAGGQGDDYLDVWSHRYTGDVPVDDVVVNEAKGRLTDTTGTDAAVGSFEMLNLENFAHSRVTGSTGPDDIHVRGCPRLRPGRPGPRQRHHEGRPRLLGRAGALPDRVRRRRQ